MKNCKIIICRRDDGWEIYDQSADRGELFEHARLWVSFCFAVLQAFLWSLCTGQEMKFLGRI